MELLEGAVTWRDSMRHPADMLQEAVQKLHDSGWVHGDIRETNVLVSSDRQVLPDHGGAPDAQWTSLKASIGTPKEPYAPTLEIFLHRVVFSFGCFILIAP